MLTLDDLSRIAEGARQSGPGVRMVRAIGVLQALGAYWLGPRVVRRNARPHPLTSFFLRYIDKPVLGVLLVVALEIVLWEAPDTLHFIVSLRDISAFALIGAITWLSVRSAAAIGEAIIRA